MKREQATGLVLSSMPVGEYDRRVVILTRERGKVAAFARGARRPGSPLSGAVSPFSFGTFELCEGRSSYTLLSASISNYFAELREDVEGAYYGFYFLEIAGYYGREGNDDLPLLKLLYQTLRALAKGTVQRPLIRRIFEWRAVCESGETPEVFQCVLCGERTPPFSFSARERGVVCGGCRGGEEGAPLSPSALYTLQFITGSPVERLYTFKVSQEVLRELQSVLDRLLEVCVDREFKSLGILETLQ